MASGASYDALKQLEFGLAVVLRRAENTINLLFIVENVIADHVV